ncbi:lipase 3 isoform X1 [Cherax quadricarinatus]|uniref:lipase 3 isoform X1 n=1 Tax=Cherax quadricarinatus TaxID=27406 RepID=UPI00387E7F8F
MKVSGVYPLQLLTALVTAKVTLLVTADNNTVSSSPPLSTQLSGTQEHPHTHLTTDQLIRVRGYPAEVHHVVTEDGYILTIHRIPHGRRVALQEHQDQQLGGDLNLIRKRASIHSNESSSNSYVSSTNSSSGGGRRVVFIHHGFLSSSADFVMNDPDQALGFILADAGYDVWLGNNRGNFYGRRHIRFSPKQPEFWDYSWNEMARYDMPAMLDYARKASGVERLSYIGHSMGTSLFFAMMSYHPHINSWISAMAAHAPAAYVYHKYIMASVLAPFFAGAEKELRKHGIMEIFRLTQENSKKASDMCEPKSLTSFLCILMYFIGGGPNSNYLDKNYLPVIFAHTPAGSGLKVFTHLRQLHASRKFRAYDHGEAMNMVKYGTSVPPPFSLSNVRVPVGLFWSENDWIVDPQDVKQTASELPWVALDYQIELRDFNHVDFLWAENANHYLYYPTIKFLEEYL